MEELAKEIRILEDQLTTGNDSNNRTWDNERTALCNFLHENVKGALIKTKISAI